MKKMRRRRGHELGSRAGREARFYRELSVLYEDDAVIALNKPAKLLAVPAENSSAPSALSLLSAELRHKRQRAFVVHRIDRYTSGILLFAKTWADREALVRQFLEHGPVRQYLAVVRGHLKSKEGTLVHHFRQDGMFQKVTRPRDPKATRAELRYSVDRALRGASLVRVWLVTGLQNQIRVQLSAIGHPVIGDRKYRSGKRRWRRYFARRAGFRPWHPA
jgi:23S rRNA pseudouridine1911/1915/1917 synthase